jgi:hypothetical protein
MVAFGLLKHLRIDCNGGQTQPRRAFSSSGRLANELFSLNTGDRSARILILSEARPC